MRARATTASREDIEATKRMFYFGFCFLPFLWLVNYVHYRKKAETSPEMKKYVYGSLFGFIVVGVAWLSWLFVFYLNLDSEWTKNWYLFDPARIVV